jgi:hypothetical protein
MVSRFVFITTGAVLLLFTGVYLSRSSNFDHLGIMSEPSSSVPMDVTLSVPPSASSDLGSAAFRVTITNTSPHAIFILTWQSPIDPRAVRTGMFKFVSTTTNTAAPCMDMKLNRRMPEFFNPDDEAIVEVPAGGKFEEDFIAKEPEVALTKGDRYKVKTEGWWMRYWVHDGSINPAHLGVDKGRSGEFLSNEIEVDVRGA